MTHKARNGHTIKSRAGQLQAKWGIATKGADPSIAYSWGAFGASKEDGWFLAEAFEGMKNCFGRTFSEELEFRNYDLTTLKFTIQQLPKKKRGSP